ncbi:S1/P1 nuclease [Sphingobacterium spiritivorum]|uniref:S1/P1 nuclease n=1 Tax=Sphingobacterium spiritivorum TaxID=258 RepID=UPI003DA4DF4A
MKKIIKLLLLLAFFAQTSSVWGWGMTGHRVVTEIAERHLTNKAKKNIAKLIGKQHLAYWANWPDFVKSDHAFDETSPFHYINTEGNLTKEQFATALQQSPDNNIYKQLIRLSADLKAKDKGLTEMQQNLYFLIHLMGDAHQPMHVGRPADLGGNKIEVMWFGKPDNIHRVWDSNLVDYEKYSYTEYANVLDIHTKQENQRLADGDFASWLYDTHIVANKIYKDVEQNSNLSYRYIYDNKYVVEDALLKGGLRLAKVLNEIFG